MKKAISSIVKIFICFVLFIAIQLVGLTGVRSFGQGLAGEGIRLAIFMIALVICTVVLVYLVNTWGDREALRRKLFNVQEIKWVLTSFLCNMVLVYAFLGLAYLMGMPVDSSGSRSAFHSFQQSGWLQATLFLLTTSITQPMLEEFLFRGVIQGYLEKYSSLFALFLSAFLFGYAHNGALLSEQLITGLILGVLYLKRRNLYSCWLLHGMINGTVTLLYFLFL